MQHQSPLESETIAITVKVKLLMIAAGSVFAIAISAIALQFISLAPKGTEFNSISDLRRAMVSADSPDTSANAETSESTPSLRAIIHPHPNDSILYTLRPNLDLTFVRAKVTTNSCGMRSPERSIAKAAGVYRIALLGDSFAFGWGVEQKATFAQKLEDSLNERANGTKRYEVLNFGVPGYSTFQEVALFEERALDFEPDAVLVYFVQNDFGMPFFIRDISGSGGLFSSMKFVQLGKRLLAPEDLNKQISAVGLDPNRALDKLAKLTAERGIKMFVTINPRKSWRRDLSQLKSIKNRPGVTIIPLRDGLLEYIARNNIPEKALTLSFDPHPSEIRHAILGALLTPYFLD